MAQQKGLKLFTVDGPLHPRQDRVKCFYLHFCISSFFCGSHTDFLSMVVYFPLLSASQGLYVCLHDDVNKGLEQVEEEPDVDHLDIGSLGQIVADVDEHRCQDEHHCNIQGDDSLKSN